MEEERGDGVTTDKEEIKSEPSTSTSKGNIERTDTDSDEEFRLPEEDAASVTEDYQDELEHDLAKAVPMPEQKIKKPNLYKPVSKIPVHLKGLMGEANLRFARGENGVAEKMCFELIRQVPRAHEPYLTLAQIYENIPDKSLQYLTISAHLCPRDVDQWLRLAQIHLDQDNLRQAVTCYNRALLSKPNEVEIHEKRIELLEKLDDQKFIRRCKIKLLHILNPGQPERILNLAKELAEQFHQEKDYAKATEVVGIAFEKCHKDITPEMVNIYLELLLLNKDYPKCLDLFVQYCNIEMEIVLDENNKINVISYNMPEKILIDLRIKFIVCLIRLEAFHLLDKLIQPLLIEDNVEYIGDLYLDVAETLMVMNHPEDALRLLVPLTKSDNFSLAAVWLKYAECLQACKMYDQAIESYFTVVKMAPQHIDVRYPLAELLLQRNRTGEALEVLDQERNAQELDVGLLIKKMQLLKQLGNHKGYFKTAEILLLRHCIEIKAYSEVHAVCFLEKGEKHNRLKTLRALRGENYERVEITSIREPSVEDEYDLFKETLRLCYERGELALLQKFAFTALSSTRFKNYGNELTIFALFSCLCNKDYFHGYAIIREMVLAKPHNNLMWNLWNVMLQRLDESRHIRFIVRQRKILQTPYLKILEANNALCAGSYKIALMILMPLLKQNPTPYVSLLTGIVFLQLSQQKIGSRKKTITPTVYSLFLHYANTRGKDALQEINYNLGRMYHKYGVLHVAAHYYNLVLEFEHHLADEHPDVLSLKREAAFNLFLIYRECGNGAGCRNLLIKYLTV